MDEAWLEEPPAGESPPFAGPYVLFVGARNAYKNLETVVRALAVARRVLPDARLVVAGDGDRGEGIEAERTTQASLGLGDAVTYTGLVADVELRRLYRHAAALVLPSLDEGFGFPLIEALACGTPIIASDIPSSREVAGDLAIFVPPTDVAALARTLVAHLTGDRGPAPDYRARARSRARTFNWDRTVRSVARVLDDVVARARAGDA